MADSTSGVANNPVKMLQFFKGAVNVAKPGLGTPVDPLELVRKDLADVLNSKNVSFLLGSGASSSRAGAGSEVGIPTMQPLAKEFVVTTDPRFKVSATDKSRLVSTLGLDLEDERYSSNLEALMEVLYAHQFSLSASSKPALVPILAIIEKVIVKVKAFVLDKCTAGAFSNGDSTVLSTYEQFYRRLVQRDRALARPWVFTTNYDLFNETAMDRLGIPYINGFMGSVERRFNPATFRYSLSEQLDIASRKWSSVDGLVYLAKLHGSVNWQSREGGLFPVVEVPPQLATGDQLLIYPTPAKQNASFASPYSDMFREFQTRVVREQSVLVSVGYSFGDEHVNNIIFQALTIPTFRLIAFIDPEANDMVRRLRSLNDPRIWIVGTADKGAAWKSHYFADFVEEFMSAEASNLADNAIERVLEQFMQRTNKDEAE